MLPLWLLQIWWASGMNRGFQLTAQSFSGIEARLCAGQSLTFALVIQPNIRVVSVSKELYFHLIWPKDAFPICPVFPQVVLSKLQFSLFCRSAGFFFCLQPCSLFLCRVLVIIFFETTVRGLAKSFTGVLPVVLGSLDTFPHNFPFQSLWNLSLSLWILFLPLPGPSCTTLFEFLDDISQPSSWHVENTVITVINPSPAVWASTILFLMSKLICFWHSALTAQTLAEVFILC